MKKTEQENGYLNKNTTTEDYVTTKSSSPNRQKETSITA